MAIDTFTPLRTDYGGKILAASVTMLVLTLLAISLRFHVRISMLKTFGLDDWLLLITQLFYLGLCSQAIWTGIVFGQNASILEKAKPVGILLYTDPLMYYLSMLSLKLALAAFFLRIVIQKWQRAVIAVTVTVYACVTIACTLMTLFRCRVLSWQNAITGYNSPECTISFDTMNAMAWTNVALNATSDWILALSPIIVISHLQLKPMARFSACALIVIGLLGSVVSLVRIPIVKTVTQRLSTGPQLIDGASNLVLVSIIEAGLGIIALSLAALRPLRGKVVELYRSSVPASLASAVREMVPMRRSAHHTSKAATNRSITVVNEPLPGTSSVTDSKVKNEMHIEEELEDSRDRLSDRELV